MSDRLTHIFIDTGISGAGISAIWGLSLTNIDLINKIFWTIVVSCVTIYSILRKKNK